MSYQSEVAVFFAEGFEEIEALTVVDLLRRAKVGCAMVAVGDELRVRGSHGIEVTCDARIADVDLHEYRMLVLPGGMPGTLGLKACAPLAEALVAAVEGGRDVAAICAAPTVLAELGLLAGRQATCYPDMTVVLEEHGAMLADGAVVVDGNVRTSRGMGTAIAFGLSIVGHLRGEDVADGLARAIVYSA